MLFVVVAFVGVVTVVDIVVGALLSRLVDIANDLIAERTALGQAALATTQGQRPRSEREHEEGHGVRHTRSVAYQARHKAKKLDKQIQWQNDLWRWSRMSPPCVIICVSMNMYKLGHHFGMFIIRCIYTMCTCINSTIHYHVCKTDRWIVSNVVRQTEK